MTRRCAVFGCDNTDYETSAQTVQMHLFPDNKAVAQEWKESLQLKEFPVELLQTKFGVCSLHFKSEDYDTTSITSSSTNKLLRPNATPTLITETGDGLLGTSLAISEHDSTETVRILAPTNANIALLQPPSTSKPYRSRSMEFSTASTGGNTDISIIRTHDSHYGDDDDDDDDDDIHDDGIHRMPMERDHSAVQRFYEHQQHSIDAPDFTVVSCAFDESTEELRFHTIKPPSRNGYSGTDSDIEVLMSEEINDTEWSAALENLENNALELRGKDDCSIEAILGHSLEDNTEASASPKRAESTDHDCSVEGFSQQSSFDEAGLSREQLINVIREQNLRIRSLESTVARYRDAQHSLFEHVDALRLEFATSTSTDLDTAHAVLD